MVDRNPSNAVAVADAVQVFTPSLVADFMAQLLLDDLTSEGVNLLDPGAGPGTLSEAVLALVQGRAAKSSMTLVEADHAFFSHLQDFATDAKAAGWTAQIVHDEFLNFCSVRIAEGKTFTHVVMNPPYARMTSTSDLGQLALSLGVRTPNLYGAFLWLGVQLLAQNGTLVALVPRSFLTGKLFAPLRRFLLRETKLSSLHRFRSRKKLFERDSVLQETVIIKLVRSDGQVAVNLSWSQSDQDLGAVEQAIVPLDRVIDPSDEDVAIHIPDGPEQAAAEPFWSSKEVLIPQGFDVSTGPVVDFRVDPPLQNRYQEHAIPVLGSELFADAEQRLSGRKRFALENSLSKKQIFEPGVYVAIKRISPSEQRPRLRVVVVQALGGIFTNGVAFENHVNVIHRGGKGMAMRDALVLQSDLARADTEEQFAEISGSTQVNVRDLLRLRRRHENGDGCD